MMRRRDDAGFTLLEILVAVTLLGLLSIALFGAVNAGAKGWGRAERHAAASTDATAVRDLLRRMIISAKPVFASTDPSTATVAFEGDASSLVLIGTLPDALAPGLQGQQRIFLATVGGQRTLMLAWRLDLPSADGGTLPETLVPLLDHVGTVRFAYFGPSADGSTRGWSDTWSNRRALPSLVNVHIESADKTLPPWPDLIAAPVATISNECRYTGLDAGCHRIP
jgi:general secretion pathway protein J